MAQIKLLILNGPNLNMLGLREENTYGAQTLGDIEEACQEFARHNKIEIDFLQSNHEGELVEIIQKTAENKAYDGIIINPAAYTHTSVALRDALELVACPVIEVHLSNIYKREEFRHKSYVSAVSTGVISGFKGYGYIMALDAMLDCLE